MSKPFKVSQSKVKTWRKCRAAYHYKYVLKLKKKVKSRPLVFGDLIHKMLEADANADNPFDILDNLSPKDLKLFKAEKEMYMDIVNDIRVIMTEYFNYWDQDSLIYLRKQKRSAEFEFEIEIAKGLVMTGKIDAVVRTPNKLKWLGENKSFGKVIPDDDTRWRNLQSVVYFRALDILGWFPGLSGVMWNYIHSKPPSVPQLLKSGELSQAKISTLPSVVRATLKEHGLKEKDHKKLLEAAENNLGNYFQRIFTPINNDLVDYVFSGFVDTAKEMMQYHGHKQDMNIDKHCSWCDYEGICRAKMTCSDVDYVIERGYTKNDEVKEERQLSE